jgi:hypothetical protein
MDKITAEHVQKKTISEIFVVPEHGQRNTFDFNKSVKQLKKDGHFKCLCGATENLEVHHISEFCFEEDTDFIKLEKILMHFDPYGYSKAMQGQPVLTVDDIRNLIVLCKPHHTGKGTGIHETDFAIWIRQFVSLEGKNPIPQKGETIEQVEERV